MKLSNYGALLWLFLCTSAMAKDSDFDAPVEIKAEHNEASLKDQTIKYWGKVMVKQGTLLIQADTLTFDRSAGQGKEIIIASGSPATYSQVLEGDKPIKASANEIRYQMQVKVLTLAGKAQINQSDSLVSGGRIQYDMVNQKLNAEQGDADEPVNTIFTSGSKSQ